MFLSFEKKNKARLFIILLTLILSSTALFVCLNGVNAVKISSEEDIRNLKAGSTEFVVYAENDLDYFKKESVKSDGKVLNSLYYCAVANFDEKREACYIQGVDKEEFLQVFKNSIEDNVNVDNNNEGVVISRYYADKVSVERGDNISVTINNEIYDFQVEAIAKDKYYFAGNPMAIIIEKEQLDKILHIDFSDINRAYIYNLSKDSNIEDITCGEGQFVDYTVNPNTINSNIMMYGIFFILIFVFVLIIVIYILFSIYKAFIFERAKYIGTLKTCGATPWDIQCFFIRGNNVLSIISGILGTILGIVIIQSYIYMKFSINYINTNIKSVILSVIIASIFPIFISSICIFILLKKIMKNSDHELIIGSLNTSGTKISRCSVVALFALIAVFIINKNYTFNNMSIAVVMFILILVLSIISIKAILYIFDLVFSRYSNKGIFHIVMNNIIRNTYVQKNITVITIVSLLLVIIGVISNSTVNVISSFYYDYNCDAIVTASNLFNYEDIEKLQSLEELTDVYSFKARRVIFNEVTSNACYILNDPEEFSRSHLNMHIYNNPTYNNSEFSKDYNCIVSENESKRYDLSVGDTITIKNNNIKQEYKIVAIAGSTLEMGQAVIISDYNIPFENFKQDSVILLKGNITKDVIEDIEIELIDRDAKVSLIQDKIERDRRNSKSIFAMFYSFSAFIVLISVQGIYNNYKLSYSLRRKEFAVMISNGYSISHIIKILLGEVIVCSILGCLIGLGSSFLFKEPITIIMRFMDTEVPLKYDIQSVIIPLVMCIGTSLLSVVFSIKHIRSSKDNMLFWIKGR